MFTQENTGTLPDLRESSIPSISDITFKIAGIEKLLTGLDTNKSNGPDEIPLRILKEYANEIAPMLTFIMQQSYDTGTLPDDWKNADVVALFKKGDRSKAENYRPVSLTAVTCKMMERVIHKQIMIHLNRNNILVKFQHGFREKHSCESQLIMTVESIQRYLNRNKQVDVLVLDFSKAFDTVAHQRLLLKLDHYGIRDKTLGWIRTWLTNRKQRVIVDGDKSEESSVTSGVPQGTVLGPLMFLLHINDIGDNVSKGTYIKLFADDCLLFREIDSLSDAESLENDLQSLVKWSKTWQMSFNVSKCHTLKICKKKNPFQFQYTMNNVQVSEVDRHPYLGVELERNMSWSQHITDTANKASSTLDFLRRSLSACSTQVKATAYKTLVRPKLEYASSVWDPHHRNKIEQLEKVQRKAARWAMNQYSWTASVSDLLHQLEWPPLHQRRLYARLIIMFKIKNNDIAITIPSYVMMPTIRTTRSLSSGAWRPIQMSTTCDNYKFSFFPRTIVDWNRLTNEIIMIEDMERFKAAVADQVLTY